VLALAHGVGGDGEVNGRAQTTTASNCATILSNIARKSRNTGAVGNSLRDSAVCAASRSTSQKATTSTNPVAANVLIMSRPRLPMPAKAKAGAGPRCEAGVPAAGADRGRGALPGAPTRADRLTGAAGQTREELAT
jgi:hypothetical protein